MSDPLAIYLHDHSGGAKAAVDLLRALREQNESEPFKEFITSVLAEVEADRSTLQGVMEKIGPGSGSLKEFSGWLGEKVTRMKLGEGAAGQLGLFEALEFLALGILGKRGMWVALNVALDSDARLQGYDFKHLAMRAETQYEQVEHQRLELAKTALRRVK